MEMEMEIAIFFNKLKKLKPKLKHYYFYYGNKMLNLPMIPNQANKNIYLSNSVYNLLSRHVEYYDQQVGTRQSILGNKDVKII